MSELFSSHSKAFSSAIAEVCEIVEEQIGIQRVRVQLLDGDEIGEKATSIAFAIHYTDTFEPIEPGDLVLLNTTAVELGLGSGGYHFVYAIVEKRKQNHSSQLDYQQRHVQPLDHQQGHIMKLRYTPMQRRVMAAEEPGSPYHPIFQEKLSIEGMPVLIGELHSMLPIACCWLQALANSMHAPLRIAYLMSDGGALPIHMSSHVHQLNQLGWLCGTVTYGHAYGGQLETVNKFSALIAARHVLHADIAIVTLGPGVVGTGTPLGHSAIEVGELVNAVHACGGQPIVMPRISFADPRARHWGLSHHQLTSLVVAAARPAFLPIPTHVTKEQMNTLTRQIEECSLSDNHLLRWMDSIQLEQVLESQAEYPIEITSMGRTTQEDPSFSLGVCAASQFAFELLQNQKQQD